MKLLALLFVLSTAPFLFGQSERFVRVDDRRVAIYGDTMLIEGMDSLTMKFVQAQLKGLAETQHNMGISAYEEKDYAKAVDLLSSALEINPAYLLAYLNRAQAYMALNDLPSAQADYERALVLSPTDARARYALSQCFTLQKNWAQARAQIEQALAQQPTEPAFLDMLGQIQMRIGDYGSALAMFEQALAHQPDFMPSVRHIADAYLYQRSYKTAIGWYNKAIAGGGKRL